MHEVFVLEAVNIYKIIYLFTLWYALGGVKEFLVYTLFLQA